MTTGERDIIKKAKSRGAVFKRDGKTRWMWQGGEYSYETRIDAAFEYLDASHLSNSATTTATLFNQTQPKEQQTMQLKTPFIITPRLMAGLQIGKAFISMVQGERNSEGRTQYGVFIDLPDGSEHEITDLRSGCQGGNLQSGFASLLSFLGSAAESYNYRGTQNRELLGENSDLFPLPVTQWAADNSDEISMLSLEIEETPELITAE